MTDAHGIPLVVKTTRANVNDGPMALPLLEAMPRIPGPRGRPREKPEVALGDRAYGSSHNREAFRACGVLPLLAQIGTAHGSGLGVLRYVVESCLSWFSNFRRLKFCYERTGEHFQAFHELAAALTCAKKLDWT